MTAIATFLAGREAGKARFLNAVQDAAQHVILALRQECDRVAAKCDAVEAKHVKCEADLAEVRAEIARMMHGPVAPYGGQQ